MESLPVLTVTYLLGVAALLFVASTFVHAAAKMLNKNTLERVAVPVTTVVTAPIPNRMMTHTTQGRNHAAMEGYRFLASGCLGIVYATAAWHFAATGHGVGSTICLLLGAGVIAAAYMPRENT